MSNTIRDDSSDGRIILSCNECRCGINVPDQGIGPALAATWRNQHEGKNATHG